VKHNFCALINFFMHVHMDAYIHWFTLSPPQPPPFLFTQQATHSLTFLLTRSLSRLPVHAYTHSFNEEIDRSMDRLDGWVGDWTDGCDWLVEWLIDWLINWLIDWLIDWFIGRLVGWLIDCLTILSFTKLGCHRKRKIQRHFRKNNSTIKQGKVKIIVAVGVSTT